MKFKFKLLLPDRWPLVFEKAKETLPDTLRTPEAFYQLLLSRDVLACELGDFGGAFWFTTLRPGKIAFVHIVIWDEELRGQAESARNVLSELMYFLGLYRVEAWIPITNIRACRYAERVGMTLEGIRRKAELYDGQSVDMAVYALLKED